jgi:hypothetical protein
MPERVFSRYSATVRGGPGQSEVTVDVIYYDDNEDGMGSYGETMIAFCTTWKDVAQVIRTGLKKLGYDGDPVSNVSPMVDLT